MIAPMFLRGRHRFRIALTVILCLLFQQVAMASYACPLERTPPKTATMAENCAAMDMAQAKDNHALCEKHCTPDRPLLTDHAALVVPALALPPLVFDLVLAQSITGVALAAHVRLDRSDPPPRLRYCSLLI